MKQLGIGALALLSACAAAQNVDHLWAASTNGDEAEQTFNDLVRGPNDNIYTVGTRHVNGGTDIVVTKTRYDGRRIWTRQLDFSANDQGRAIDFRSDGSLVLTGSVSDGISTRLLLVRISGGGQIVWSRQIDSPGLYNAGHDVQLADDDSIVVTGSTSLLLGLLQQPFVARFNESGTVRKWFFDLPGEGTGRQVVLGDNRVYYAGERRTILNDLGIQVVGDAYVGSCSLSTGGNRDTQSIGALNLSYERIHQLTYAGKNRVLFCGWQGDTILGEAAVPIYGMYNLNRADHLSYTTDDLSKTVATDISYDSRTNRFAVIGTSIRGNTTRAYVKVGNGNASGGFDLGNAILLPGEGGYAHSIGFTPDGYWAAHHANDGGSLLTLGDEKIVAVNRMPRLSLGWSPIGIPASEHPPKDASDTMFWYAGDNPSGARVTGNEYLPGPQDTFMTKEDRPISRDVTLNDGTPLLGERKAEQGPVRPKHGTLTFAAGTITYVPEKNFSGTDSFSYRLIVDGRSVLTVPVSVVVTAVNDAPSAKTRTFHDVSSTEPTLLHIVSGSEDPDASDRVVIQSFTAPPHGTAVARNAGKDILYTPEKGFKGTVTFKYTIQDKFGRTSTGTIKLEITR